MGAPSVRNPQRRAILHAARISLMGANLVMQVFAGWTHVSDRAFRVLVRMAVTALDNPGKGQAAGIYHGGRELLAMSLRGKGGTDRTRYRSVAEAVAELTEAGAIEHLATGWAGQNAVYRLTLGRPESASRDDGMGGSTAHPMGVLRDHPMDVPRGTKWMGPGHTPRNQEEPIGERGEEEGAVLETVSHPPRVIANVIPIRRVSRVQAELEAAAVRRRQAESEHRSRLAEETS
jgi:hypothetical protein